MRRVLAVVGVLMILLGALWTLQGVNLIVNSPMSGQSMWAIIGVILLIVGAALCYLGLRPKPVAPVS